MVRHCGFAMPVTSSALPTLVHWGGRCIVFSGDVGRYGDPLFADPVSASENPDYIMVESTMEIVFTRKVIPPRRSQPLLNER